MANPGTVNVDLQMTGSAIRLRSLQLAIGTLNHDFTQGPVASKEEILKRADAFEQYIEHGKPEEAAPLADITRSAIALSINEQLRGVNIRPADAEFLINSIKARTRS